MVASQSQSLQRTCIKNLITILIVIYETWNECRKTIRYSEFKQVLNSCCNLKALLLVNLNHVMIVYRDLAGITDYSHAR